MSLVRTLNEIIDQKNEEEHLSEENSYPHGDSVLDCINTIMDIDAETPSGSSRPYRFDTLDDAIEYLVKMYCGFDPETPVVPDDPSTPVVPDDPDYPG